MNPLPQVSPRTNRIKNVIALVVAICIFLFAGQVMLAGAVDTHVLTIDNQAKQSKLIVVRNTDAMELVNAGASEKIALPEGNYVVEVNGPNGQQLVNVDMRSAQTIMVNSSSSATQYAFTATVAMNSSESAAAADSQSEPAPATETAAESVAPTSAPTETNTIEPTATTEPAPVMETEAPAAEPTLEPTAVPTLEPTAEPTLEPTAEAVPTEAPAETVVADYSITVTSTIGSDTIANKGETRVVVTAQTAPGCEFRFRPWDAELSVKSVPGSASGRVTYVNESASREQMPQEYVVTAAAEGQLELQFKATGEIHCGDQVSDTMTVEGPSQILTITPFVEDIEISPEAAASMAESCDGKALLRYVNKHSTSRTVTLTGPETVQMLILPETEAWICVKPGLYAESGFFNKLRSYTHADTCYMTTARPRGVRLGDPFCSNNPADYGRPVVLNVNPVADPASTLTGAGVHVPQVRVVNDTGTTIIVEYLGVRCGCNASFVLQPGARFGMAWGDQDDYVVGIAYSDTDIRVFEITVTRDGDLTVTQDGINYTE